MNEEDVKNKIVLPFLGRLGIDIRELSFERTFNFHFGSLQLTVDGMPRDSGRASARLDILVQRGNVPLMVVEVKESGHEILITDRDQATSYARLLHPIAPYVLVTNGTDYQLYDAISKSVVNSQDFVLKNGYEVVLPNSARNEAIDLFLGYSPANLQQFCRTQVTEQLKPLIGSPYDITKKYVPELTVSRTDLCQILANFERSTSQAFLLLANSGNGKTSALCDYAQRRLAENKPTIFYSGNRLEGSLLASLTSDFNWTFTEQISPPALMKRIASIAKGIEVVIILDAMDEWSYDQKAQSLLNFLTGARNLGVKFIISCKSGTWDAISRPRGSDFGFADNLFPGTSSNPGDEGFVLGSFSPSEFNAAIRRYRQVFHVTGGFEDKVLNEARQNPFLLRVLFAVAANSGLPNLTFSSREFFERYFASIALSTGRRDLAEAQLTRIARILADRNRAVISEETMRQDLGLSPAESILPALFEQNILQRTSDGIGFYFQQLRDFLIAFRAFQWAALPPERLAAIQPVGVLGEALIFYLRYATVDQWRAVTGPIMGNAEQYLQTYQDTIGRYFPSLVSEFEPRGAPIGFIAEYAVPQRSLGGYGFRIRKPKEPAIELIPVDRFFTRSNLLQFAGAKTLFHAGSSNGFRSMNVHHEVVENEVIRQMNAIVDERRLDVRSCVHLVEEGVIALVAANSTIFPLLFEANRRAIKFPIESHKVSAALRRAKLTWHFEEELIEEKRRNGKVQEYWHGDTVSYTRPLPSAEERIAIAAKTDAVMATGRDPESSSFTATLRELEENLSRYGVGTGLKDFTIAGPPWANESTIADLFRRNPIAGSAMIRDHLRKLLHAYITEYTQVVDTNFPTMTAAFELSALLPLRVFVEFSPDILQSPHHVGGDIQLVYQSLAPSSESEVIICEPGKLVMGRTLDEITYEGRAVTPVEWVTRRGLMDYFYTLGARSPLHDLIFGRIAKEWQSARRRLLKLEGLNQSRS